LRAGEFRLALGNHGFFDKRRMTVRGDEIVIIDYEAICAAGAGKSALRAALAEQRSGLRPNDFPGCDLSTWIGRVPAIDDYVFAPKMARWKSRNNALIALGLAQGNLQQSLAQLVARFGSARIGVVMGSSTSSIDRSEEAYRSLGTDGKLAPEFLQDAVLNPHAPGLFVAELLGLDGPNMTVNTACSSSAKVFASAARWLRAGIVDAVLVGGADTLCQSVLYGFHSLQLVSEAPCRPFDSARDGINLGEAAGFALLTRADADAGIAHCGISVSGYGESSDAHHMSHPHPDGAGAHLAIEQALSQAGLAPADINYINLHGTASRANDHIEGNLVGAVFPATTLVSSTKGWTGHTLGAAGILESIFALEALATGLVPGTLNLTQIDPEIVINMSAANHTAELTHVMSNSFGFGGNNACLIFSRKEIAV
jgi:3-oxoacyl-[acyl-carrier-protein] synthase I